MDLVLFRQVGDLEKVRFFLSQVDLDRFVIHYRDQTCLFTPSIQTNVAGFPSTRPRRYRPAIGEVVQKSRSNARTDKLTTKPLVHHLLASRCEIHS